MLQLSSQSISGWEHSSVVNPSKRLETHFATNPDSFHEKLPRGKVLEMTSFVFILLNAEMIKVLGAGMENPAAILIPTAMGV